MKKTFVAFMYSLIFIACGFCQESIPMLPDVAVTLIEEEDIHNWHIESERQLQLLIAPCSDATPDVIQVYNIDQKRFLRIANKGVLVISPAAVDDVSHQELKIIVELKQAVSIPGIIKTITFMYNSNVVFISAKMIVEDIFGIVYKIPLSLRTDPDDWHQYTVAVPGFIPQLDYMQTQYFGINLKGFEFVILDQEKILIGLDLITAVTDLFMLVKDKNTPEDW